MKKLLICLIAIFVSGCAAKKLSETDEQRIRNVGVVSIIPEDATFQKIGLTVFNNEKTVIDMNGQLTATITSTVNSRLAQSRPQWKVKDIGFEQSALLEKYKTSDGKIPSDPGKIKKDLAQLAKNNGLDAIIVFFPMSYEHAIPGKGVGVILRTMSLSSIGRGYAHAAIGMTFVDQQGETMVYEHIGAEKFSKAIDVDGYGMKYSLEANMTPEMTDRLKADMKNLLQQNITTTLISIGM
ncbi:hypothetical protein ACFQPC_00960 [Herminiimonas glaciei]|uniref:Lipoprotein n=1 Tax=Herminiimonas glaciei TaxID=523788 RepID=A0ABW2I6H1_9BURK